MATLTVNCKQCGELLEVDEGASFLTCTACSSELAVHRDGNTAYTEVLEVIEAVKTLKERTDQEAEDAEAQSLRLERELESKLETLEREWVEEKKDLLLQSGGKTPPTKEQAMRSSMWTVITGIVFVVCAIQFIFGDSADNVVGILCILSGMVFVVVGAARGASLSQKAERYIEAQKSYETRRRQLLQDIEAGRRTVNGG